MSGSPLDASVTLDEVLTVVCARRVPLAPELAGYLALEIAEQADPEGGEVDARSVFVGEEGTVALVRPKREAVRGDAEASIRAALATLLDASGSQTPALTAASRRKHGAGLSALVDELEAALIPVNRAAGRRALARLAREVKRVTLGVGRHTLPSSSSLRSSSREIAAASARIARDPPTTEFTPPQRTPPISEADVDAFIAQFGEDDPTRTPAPSAAAATPPPPSANGEDIDAWLGSVDATPTRSGNASGVAADAPPHPPPTPIEVPRARSGRRPDRAPPSAGGEPEAAAPGPVDARQTPTQPSELKRSVAAMPATPPARPKKAGVLPFVAGALVLVAAGSYAAWRLRPIPVAARPSEPIRPPSPRDTAPAHCFGTLVVGDVPPHAEVLLRQGQAPVDIPRMPVGARLEFVATAEGYAPKRVVIPAGIAWDSGADGRPRFEAAVQLEPSATQAGVVDPWPAGEPGSSVGGQGPPGTVHVVSTPRGAEVWMLAGIGPEARIDHVACDHDIDVLVAGPTTYRKRLHVTAGDFAPADGARTSPPAAPTARVSAN